MSKNSYQNTRETIGIIGAGVVGTAVKSFYKNAKIYDKFKPSNSWNDVASCNIIFICLPTPFKNGWIDLSAIDEVIENLPYHSPHGKIVIIKSTVIPGTTDSYQKIRPDLNLFHIPEFLREKTAKKDFAKPDMNIIGTTDKSNQFTEEVISILPPAPTLITTAKESEMIKYAINAYLALKIIFANQIYDICKKLEIDYDLVKDGMCMDSRISCGHLDVFTDGYRGFSGKCLPKDLKTLIALAKKLNLKPELFKTVEKINSRLLKEKKK